MILNGIENTKIIPKGEKMNNNVIKQMKDLIKNVDDKKDIKELIRACYEKERKIIDKANSAAKKFLETKEGKQLIAEASVVFEKHSITMPVQSMSVVLKIDISNTDEVSMRSHNKEHELILSSGEKIELCEAAYKDNILKMFDKHPQYIQAKKELFDKLESFFAKLSNIAKKEGLDKNDLWFFISQKCRSNA